MKLTKTMVRRSTVAAVAAAVVMVGVPAANAATPHNTTPPGGGWSESDDAVGDCGISVINGGAIGGGKVEVQAQLISSEGAITGGTATITWNGGSKSYDPQAADGNWVSPIYTINAKAGETLTVLLTGFALTSDGDDCTIAQPVIHIVVT